METYIGSFHYCVFLSWFHNLITYLRNFNISNTECLFFSFMGPLYLQKKQNFPAKRNCFCHDLVFKLQMGKTKEEAKHVSSCHISFFHSFFFLLHLCFKCCYSLQGPREGDVNMEIITWIAFVLGRAWTRLIWECGWGYHTKEDCKSQESLFSVIIF